MNDLMREANPAVLRQDGHEVAFDLLWRRLFRQVEPLSDARNVRVDDDTGGDAKRRAQNDVRRLARRARYGEQLADVARYLAAEIGEQLACRADNRLRLVVKEAGRVNVLGEFSVTDVRKVRHRRILSEQPRRDLIHALVGALRRKNCRYQKLPGVRMMERASDVREHLVENGEDAKQTILALARVLRLRRARGLFRRLNFRGLSTGQTKRIILIVAAALVAFGAAPWGTYHLDDFSLLGDSTPPVRWLTWLTYSLNGKEAWALLAVNLALHVANALLLFRLTDRFSAALIFAAHPLCAEPVNYIFARATLLCATLLLVAANDWKRGREWRAVAWLALALTAKEDALAAPLVLVLFEQPWRAGRGWRKPIIAAFALCAVAGAWSLYAAMTTPGSGAAAQAGVSPVDYWIAQGAVVARYLAKFVLPWNLTLDPQIDTSFAWLGWAAVGAVAALVRRKEVWTALLLLLPSTLVPLADRSADRRMYLPVAAIAVALPAQAIWAVPVLAALAARQTAIWRTEEGLWRYVVEQSPNELRPKIQLSRAVSPAECLALLAPLEERWPNDARIPNELGRCALQSGDAARALGYFGKALALDPASDAARANRDTALKALGALPR